MKMKWNKVFHYWLFLIYDFTPKQQQQNYLMGLNPIFLKLYVWEAETNFFFFCIEHFTQYRLNTASIISIILYYVMCFLFVLVGGTPCKYIVLLMFC